MVDLTVVTATIGDTAWRLEIFFRELRKYTSLSFKQVLCDDGTISEDAVNRQRQVCEKYGVQHYVNPGPYGVSFNLNHAFEQVDTPWVYVIEDGLRPGMGWLEYAVDVINKIGNRQFSGHEVGMIGFYHIQDWVLAMAGAIPSKFSVMDFYGPANSFIHENVVRDFYGDWNDGYWCWNRIVPGLHKACHGDTTNWRDEVLAMKEFMLREFKDYYHWSEPWKKNDIGLPRSEEARHFPERRTAGIAWRPGAFMLVNMDKWRKVGRFRDNCTMFEGHLGVRMGKNGFLSLGMESPPWLHAPSQGFRAAESQKPRTNLDTMAVFTEDFAPKNFWTADEWGYETIGKDKIASIGEELRTINIDIVDGWNQFNEI